MAEDFSNSNLLDLVEARIGLEDVPEEPAARILAGGVRGRILVQPS